MDLFTQVKMAVSVKEAAEYYGLEVKRGSIRTKDDGVNFICSER